MILMLFCSLNSAFSQDREIKTLGSWMTGSWDTFAQVEADEEADAKYRHTRALLQVTPVKIPEFTNGLTLYVENQAAETHTKPYRQRVYFFSRINGKITLQIYRINQAEDFINARKNPNLLKNLTFERLTKEVGCDLVYEKTKNTFKGKIVDAKSCKSTLRGATYTYSESEISKDRWLNLDQGFDDAGNHKWGPPPGTVGHIFRKRKM